MQAVGLLEAGSKASIAIAGPQAEKLPADERTWLRREHLGFVSTSSYNLLPDFDARENVVMPQMILGTPRAECEVRADICSPVSGSGARLTTPEAAFGRRTAAPSRLPARSRTGPPWCWRRADRQPRRRRPPINVLAISRPSAGGQRALVATHNERLASRMDRVGAA